MGSRQSNRHPRRLARDESGITLIELMVVVMLISILLGLTATTWMRQRTKAWNAQVISSLRHMATAEESHVADNRTSSYASDVSDLRASGFSYDSDSIDPSVVGANDKGYCLEARSAQDPSIVYHYDSDEGKPASGPAPVSCEASSSGTQISGGTGSSGGSGTGSGEDEGGPGGSGNKCGQEDEDGDGIPNHKDPDWDPSKDKNKDCKKDDDEA